jgi:predicted CxxxxCH...CXXCH cytochrome family protein
VRFGTTFKGSVNQSGGSYDNGTYRCNNVYCHSNGTDNAAFNTPSQWPRDNTVRWDDTVGVTCNTCHGANAVNLTSGAHDRHLGVGYGCSACHVDTALDNATIKSGTGYTLHVNGFKDVRIAPSYDNDTNNANNYNTGTKTCSGIACHGGNAVVWTATSLSCDVCHARTNDVNAPADVYDYVWNAGTGTMSKIRSSDYTSRGHGLNGTLPWTGGTNPGGKVCLDCHTNALPHDNAANPFRFRPTINGSAVAPDNVNTVCYACHNSSNFREHSKAVTGGGSSAWGHSQKCVDCHEVHGESNIFMVYDNIVWQDNTATPDNATSNRYGVPYFPASRATVTFTANTAGSNYASVVNGVAGSGICEVCHERTSQYQRSNANGKAGPQGHSTAVCTGCHKHDGGFKGSGGGNVEQFFDHNYRAGDANNYNDSRSGHPLDNNNLTFGTLNCYTCHGVAGSAAQTNECNKCHYENRTGAPTHPNTTFEWAVPNSPAAQFGSATPQGAVPDGFCLLCHDQNSTSSANLGGVAPLKVVPAGKTWAGGWGHGSTADLKTPNHSTSGPQVACRECHYSAGTLSSADSRNNGKPGFHASVNRKLVGNDNVLAREYPHPADTGYDNNARSGAMDTYCLNCHQAASVTSHTWNDIGGGARTSTETHGSNLLTVPDAARFKVPDNIPLSEYLNYATTPPTSATNVGNVVCVTCHNPHVPTAGIDNADAQMARDPWKDTGNTLCRRCHK